MIEYAFEDSNGTQYNLNDTGIEIIARNSLTYQDLKVNFENRIIEKTFLSGSHFIGESRLKPRQLSFDLKRTGDNFETQLNTFIKNAKSCRYLIDLTNSRRIKVIANNINVKYEKGSLKKMSSESIDFICLDPFWENVIETSILNEALTADIDNDITIDNDGYLDTYGRLVFSTSVVTSEIIAYITEANEGIKIEDSLFGNGAYTTMELDNYNGTLIISVGSDEYDRIPFITPGSGFFRFPVGSNTLRIIPNAACEVDIYFRKRYYE